MTKFMSDGDYRIARLYQFKTRKTYPEVKNLGLVGINCRDNLPARGDYIYLPKSFRPMWSMTHLQVRFAYSSPQTGLMVFGSFSMEPEAPGLTADPVIYEAKEYPIV